MRLLIAAHGYPPTHSAGAERRAARMAEWMSAQGHYVEVLAIEQVNADTFHIETQKKDGIPVHRLHYHLRARNLSDRNYYDHATVAETLQALLTRTQFDLVHVISDYLLGAPAVLIPKQHGIPVAVTLTEYWFMCARLNLIRRTGELCPGPTDLHQCAQCLLEEKRRYRYGLQALPALWNLLEHMPFAEHIYQQLEERRNILMSTLGKADLVVCPSQFLLNTFSSYGFDTSHFTFVRQGMAIPQQVPAAPPRADTAPLRAGYIGQIKYHKGVDLLINAVIQLLSTGYDVTLDLWGDELEEADYTAELKARCRRFPQIRWNGKYTGSAVWDVLNSLDTVVIPSRWYENSPNSILEASVMHIPVIATNLGGMAELVEHDVSGLLFELNDASSLAQQLRRLVDEPNLLTRLRQGIKPVKTIDEEMQEILTHYRRVIENRPSIRSGVSENPVSH